MKADYYGTPTEAKRYIVGWMTPARRREHPEMGRCRDCSDFAPPHAGHGEACARHGFSTRPGATCSTFNGRGAPE